MSLSELEDDHQLILAEFSAEWCWTCQTMDNIVEQLEAEYSDRVKFVHFDIENMPNLKTRFKIKSIPTFILFSEKETIWRQAGLMTLHEMKATLNKYL